MRITKQEIDQSIEMLLEKKGIEVQTYVKTPEHLKLENKVYVGITNKLSTLIVFTIKFHKNGNGVITWKWTTRGKTTTGFSEINWLIEENIVHIDYIFTSSFTGEQNFDYLELEIVNDNYNELIDVDSYFNNYCLQKQYCFPLSVLKSFILCKLKNSMSSSLYLYSWVNIF